jgi:hypothetical protein
MGGVNAKPSSAAWTPGAGFCALDRWAKNNKASKVLRMINDFLLNGILLRLSTEIYVGKFIRDVRLHFPAER